MEESLVVCICFSLSWCGGYARPVGSAEINLFNQPCGATLVTLGREKWTFEMPWINLGAEASYGYVMCLVFREVGRKKIRTEKRWRTEIEKEQDPKNGQKKTKGRNQTIEIYHLSSTAGPWAVSSPWAPSFKIIYFNENTSDRNSVHCFIISLTLFLFQKTNDYIITEQVTSCNTLKAQSIAVVKKGFNSLLEAMGVTVQPTFPTKHKDSWDFQSNLFMKHIPTQLQLNCHLSWCVKARE